MYHLVTFVIANFSDKTCHQGIHKLGLMRPIKRHTNVRFQSGDEYVFLTGDYFIRCVFFLSA